jgi:hypothetical protein
MKKSTTGTTSAFGNEPLGLAGRVIGATPAIGVPTPALAVRTRTA